MAGSRVSLETIHKELRANRRETRANTARLDKIDLNGQAQTLKQLADAAPAILAMLHPDPESTYLRDYVKSHMKEITEFIEYAPAVFEQMRERQTDSAIFWRVLRQKFQWLVQPSKLLRAAIKTLLAAGLGALAWSAVNHFVSTGRLIP